MVLHGTRVRPDPDRRPVSAHALVTDRERHPADIVRLLLGAALFVTFGALARGHAVSDFETNLFRVVNQLPNGLRVPFEVVMQLGTFWAVVVVAGIALVLRKWWIAAATALAGTSAFLLEHYGKSVVARGRPVATIGHVVAHGKLPTNFGYPSGHASVAAALATALVPYISRRWSRTVWTGVVLVALARIYIGAHLPFDVIGGFALGWAVGSAVNLILGAPCSVLDPAAIRRVLAAAHRPVDKLEPVEGGGRDAMPYLATTAAGEQLFVKVIDHERRDADALAGVSRYLAYRHVEDESPFATAKQRVEHEALLASFAAEAGAHVARPIAIASDHDGPCVLVLEAITGQPVGEDGATVLDDATVTAVWKEIAALHAARIAHRHLSLRSVMLDQAGQPWIVDFGYAQASASDRALAQDVAGMLSSLALVVGAERATNRAVAVLGKPAVEAALPLVQPLALTTATRRALRHHKGLLDETRNDAADAVGVEHVKLEPLTRIRLRQIVTLACLFVAMYLLLPQVGELQQTLDAARHADIAWLVLAVVTSSGVFLGAALSLSGAVLSPLALGRTFVTQMASSFSNKITPAGLGGMGVNVRYLERSGVGKGDAVGAIALNGTVGFIVHIGALVVSATLLGHTGLPPVTLPSGWTLLVVFVLVLSAVGIVLETSYGRKHLLLPTERTIRDLYAVLRRPTKAAQLLGGSLLVLGSYIFALGLSLAAFHAHASWLDVTTVYLGGSAVASAAPTPGKVGAVEAALIAGITRVGVASGPAVAGVLAFRLATFWLPIIPGYLAFRSLTRRDLL